MTQKQQQRSFSLLQTGVTALILLSVIAFLLLPRLINTLVLPPFLAKVELGRTSADITRLGLYHTEISASVTRDEQSIISLPRIDIDYTPVGIFRKELKQIKITRAALHLQQTENGLQLLSQKKVSAPAHAVDKGDGPAQAADSGFKFPFAINRLMLEDCDLILHQKNGRILTFSLSGFMQLKGLQQDNTLESLVIDLKSTGAIDSSFNGLVTSSEEQYLVKLNNIQLHDFQQFESVSPELFAKLPLTGRAAAQAELRIDRDSLLLDTIHADLHLPEFQAKGQSFSLTSSLDTPLQLSVSGNSESLQYQLTGLKLEGGVDGKINLKGTVTIFPSFSISGEGLLTLGRPLKQTVPVTIDYRYKTGAPGHPEFILHAATGQILEYTPGSNKALTVGSLAASLESNPENNGYQFQVSGRDVHVQQSDKDYLAPEIIFEGDALISNGAASGKIRLHIGELADKTTPMRIDNIGIETPFTVQLDDPLSFAANAVLFVEKVIYQNNDLASLSGTMNYMQGKATLKARLQTPLQKDLGIDIAGEIQGQQYDFAIHLPTTQVDFANFQPLFTMTNPPDFTGTISLEGRYNNDNRSASFTLTDGNLSMTEPQLSISNISTTVTLPQLPESRSNPSQKLTADAIDIGGLHFRKAQINYRFEDSSTLFIEKSQLGWCDGKVDTGSLRLTPNTTEFETTLYCDRLNFGQLLMQLGVQGAEGNGSLNGRLPLAVNEKGVFFDDAFLFSTPGENGILHFNNTQMLRSGLPDIDQAVTLNYSMQALENFTYDWSRLRFKSEQDKLTLTLELKGQPSSPLPFALKNGQMVQDDQGAGLQYPLRLDLNFNLPQEDIFRFGKNLQKIKENL